MAYHYNDSDRVSAVPGSIHHPGNRGPPARSRVRPAHTRHALLLRPARGPGPTHLGPVLYYGPPTPLTVSTTVGRIGSGVPTGGQDAQPNARPPAREPGRAWTRVSRPGRRMPRQRKRHGLGDFSLRTPVETGTRAARRRTDFPPLLFCRWEAPPVPTGRSHPRGAPPHGPIASGAGSIGRAGTVYLLKPAGGAGGSRLTGRPRWWPESCPSPSSRPGEQLANWSTWAAGKGRGGEEDAGPVPSARAERRPTPAFSRRDTPPGKGGPATGPGAPQPLAAAAQIPHPGPVPARDRSPGGTGEGKAATAPRAAPRRGRGRGRGAPPFPKPQRDRAARPATPRRAR